MKLDEYCRDKAARSGSSLYYSLLFQAPAQRRAIIAIHAFALELRDVIKDCRDNDIAQQTLQWWRLEIARTHAGNATHPVCQALQEAITAFALPQALFQQIINGHEQDLRQMAYATTTELDAYCHQVGGALQQLTATVSGFQQQETRDYALRLGGAIQLTHILRTIHSDGRRGKLYLPRDEMSRHGVTEKDFNQARSNDNMQHLLAAQIRRANDHLEQALDLLPAQDRATQRYGLIQAALCHALLDKLQKNPCRALNEQISLSPLRKLWIAWRTR